MAGLGTMAEIRPVFDRLMANVQWIGSEATGPLEGDDSSSGADAHASRPMRRRRVSLRHRDWAPSLRAAWETLSDPRPLLLMAPRHLELTASLLDDWSSHHPVRRVPSQVPETGVVILDTLGELDALIPQAHTVLKLAAPSMHPSVDMIRPGRT